MFLKWAIIFAILAFITGLLGFTKISSGSATIARILFAFFLIGVLIFVILGFVIVT